MIIKVYLGPSGPKRHAINNTIVQAGWPIGGHGLWFQLSQEVECMMEYDGTHARGGIQEYQQ